jgi:hypothetical protein
MRGFFFENINNIPWLAWAEYRTRPIGSRTGLWIQHGYFRPEVQCEGGIEVYNAVLIFGAEWWSKGNEVHQQRQSLP